MEPSQTERGPAGWRADVDPGEARESSEQKADFRVVDLLRELGRESQALVRGEAQLLRAEMSEKIAHAERGVASMMGGVAVLFAGSVLLLSAIALALSLVMATWVAFLIVGAVAAIIGGAMVMAGKKRLEPRNLKPELSIEEAKNDSRFVRHHLGS